MGIGIGIGIGLAAQNRGRESLPHSGKILRQRETQN